MQTSTALQTLCLAGLFLATPVAFAQNPTLPGSSSMPPSDLAALREQVEHVRVEAHEQLQLAQNRYGTGRAEYGGAIPLPPRATLSRSGSRSGPDVLLLCSTGVATEHATEISEDLAIMTRVLERALKDQLPQGINRAMGLELMFLPGGSPTKATYLEDYGVIFSLRVGFPLLPAADPEPAAQTETQPENTEWEAARRDLYGGGESGGKLDPFAGHGLHLDRAQPMAEPYNAEQVEELQQGLFNTLKQADQIRHLQPTDHILVYVEGATPSSAKPGTGIHVENRVVTRSTGSADNVLVWQGPGQPHESGTLLTLRVRVEDAREFASGTLDLPEFRNRAAVRIYPERLDPEP